MNDDEIAIKVTKVSKVFKLPHEQQNSIKSRLINHKKRGYEIQEALKDVSFEIHKGDFFGIVGKNGSGKSTLLKILSGIYTPSAGSVEVKGKLTPFIELGVGFNPELSGRDNVFLNGALLGFNRKQMEEMYDEIVDFAEIERFMDQKLKNYSSGMQVRLAFSIAIRANTDILVLDEVLAVGDAAFQQKCFDYFAELKERGTTVVLVTHDMSSVKRFCNRAMIISNGFVEAIGRPNDIADLYAEENIAKTIEPEENHTKTNLRVDIIKSSLESGQAIELNILHAGYTQDFYIGISIQSNGFAFGEYNSKSITTYGSSSKLTIETVNLNPGKYVLGVALLHRETGAVIDFDTKAAEFIVKGSDDQRGGAMKIHGVWSNVDEA